ncbi:hypothetical protein EJB05_31659, partial [Eragrostis curvula]
MPSCCASYSGNLYCLQIQISDLLFYKIEWPRVKDDKKSSGHSKVSGPRAGPSHCKSLLMHLLEELEQAFPDDIEAYREIRATAAATLSRQQGLQ